MTQGAFTNIDALKTALAARYHALPENPKRERAWEAFNVQGLPSKRMEDWRWSGLGESLLTNTKASPTPVATPAPQFDGVHITLADGRFTWQTDLPDGLSITPSPHPLPIGGAEDAPMAALATALSGGDGGASGLVIEVTKPLPMPIVITIKGTDGVGQFGRLQGLVRDSAAAEIIEIYEGSSSLTSVAMDWDIRAKAQFTRHCLQTSQADSRISAFTAVLLSENAEFTQNLLSFGAKWARLETDITFADRFGKARLNAASLIGDGLHSDTTTRVRHAAQSCETAQKHKTAVRAGGKAIFQGKFIVPRHVGQFTFAEMAHDALLLENGAAVFAKPELEIYADDVECAHGNTSGSLDQNALFYARQRGIPEAEARAMLTYAFIAEGLAKAPPSFLEMAGAWLGVDESWT